MWEHLMPLDKQFPHATTILFGAEVIEKFTFLGTFDPTKEVLAYRNYTEVSEAGETQVNLDVFALSKFRPELAASIQWKGAAVFVVSFDWLRPDQWPQQVTELEQIVEEREGSAKLLVTAHNFTKIEGAAAATLSLNKDIDVCHQFLRTAAMKLHAVALVYPLETVSPDLWKTLLFHAIGVPTQESQPEQNYLGKPIVVYSSSDTEQKILTLNPEFDFKAAFENSIQLKPILPIPEPNWKPLPSLPSMLEQVINEFGNKSGEPVSTQKLKKVLASGNEEHRVMSDFFSTLAEKSS